MNYPGIRGLILDATFDHLEPLAIPRYHLWFIPQANEMLLQIYIHFLGLV